MTWACPDCGHENSGDDCRKCGTPYLWTNPRPEWPQACPHCGWEPLSKGLYFTQCPFCGKDMKDE